MDLQDFRKDIFETVRVAAELKQDFVRACFVEEMGARLTAAEEFADFMICRFEGIGASSKKLQVDGYCYDETDGSVALMVANFSNDEEWSTFGAGETRKSFGMLRGFLEDALSGKLTDGSIEESQQGYGLASDLIIWRPSITRFRFYLVSDSQLSTTIKDWPIEDIAGIPTEFHIWDIGRFHAIHESTTGRDELIVDFTRFGCEGLPSLRAGKSQGDYVAYLCMIPGAVLADIYDSFGSRLLEGNVRSFLTAKGKVNAKIQATVKNTPEMFFAYNNGITATAEHIILEETPNGLAIKAATNLQIVNGGQTTASLAYAKRKDNADLSKISVQMKLSVLPSARAGELIPEIARFANSQNKVSDADFFANHPFHIRVEELSRRLFTPPAPGRQHGSHWFYERARGQYVNEQAKLTSGQKTQFLLQNPKLQLLTKTDVAKLENTWRGLPHKVSFGAQKNFSLFAEWVAKAWSEDESQFNEEYFRNLIAIALLFRQTEALVSKQPWYQGGYRANIVTYSLAKLHQMISEQRLGYRLSLRRIWECQAVAQEIQDQICAIAGQVFLILTSNSRPKENVTEWAKMQGCWDQVRSHEILVDKSIDSHLYDVRGAIEAEKTAKLQQKVDDGISLQISVLEIPGGRWAKLRDWGNQRGLLTSKELELLKLASSIPMRVPSEKQCALIWHLRSRLVENGYRD